MLNHVAWSVCELPSERNVTANSIWNFRPSLERAEDSFVGLRRVSKLLVPVERAARSERMPQLTFNHTHPGTGSVTQSSRSVIRWQWASLWCSEGWWVATELLIKDVGTGSIRGSNRPGIDVWLWEQQVTSHRAWIQLWPAVNNYIP